MLRVVVGEAGSVGEIKPASLITAGGELARRNSGVVLGVTEVVQGDRELSLVAGRLSRRRYWLAAHAWRRPRSRDALNW